MCVANIYVARLNRISEPKDIVFSALLYGGAVLLSAGLRGIYRRANYRSRTIRSLALITIPAAAAAAVIWQILSRGLLGLLYQPSFADQGAWAGAFAPAMFAQRVFSMMWPFMMWSILYFVINFYLEWRRERDRAVKATLLAQKAHLQMLRYQLNPHFLFNALNSIRALVDENTESARAMITELAEFLRYSLVHRDYGDVPVASEMEAVGHYLSIQSRRYEEKLEISTEISNAAGQFPVPCFLIHPLVENAVKYGMQTSPMPLKIAIEAAVRDGNLTLTVSNTGKWVEPQTVRAPAGAEPVTAAGPAAGSVHATGTGTGLENVRQRLDAAFPGRHRLEIAEKEGRVVVVLEIHSLPRATETTT